MRFLMRCLALCLAMLMMIPAAAAEVPFLRHAAGWTLDETPLEATLSADVLSWMPYDEDRLEMLRQVTDRLSLHLRTGENEGSVTILVGLSEALTLAYRGDEVQFSCIPRMSFTTAEEDAMGKLLGESTQVSAPYGLRGEAESLLDDGWFLLEAIGPAFEKDGVRKNVKTTITDMGLARTCTDYTIPSGRVEEMKEKLLAGCPEGWLKEILSGLTFSGRQTLRVYRTQDGVPLRMEYNGSCGPEGDLRTVKLIWRMRRDDTAHRDEVTLTSPAKSGTNKNSLTFERVMRKNKQGALEMKGSFTYTATLNKQTATRKGEFSLKNEFTESSDVLSGKVTLQQKLPGEESFAGLTLEPQVTISGTQEEPQISGSVTLSTLMGGDVLDSALLRLAVQRSTGVAWQDSEESIDLDQLSEAELAALRADAANSVAGALLRPLILLLGEDAEWFFRDMLPEQIQRITDAAQTIVID